MKGFPVQDQNRNFSLCISEYAVVDSLYSGRVGKSPKLGIYKFYVDKMKIHSNIDIKRNATSLVQYGE